MPIPSTIRKEALKRVLKNQTKGQRKDFYEKLLKMFKKEALTPTGERTYRKATMKDIGQTLTSASTKQDIRHIKNKTFKNIKEVKATHPFDLSTHGYYIPKKKEMGFNPDYLAGTHPNRRKTIPHEIYHSVRPKHSEKEAEEFADWVIKRSEGISLKEVPKKYRKWLLGIAGSPLLLNDKETEAYPGGSKVIKPIVKQTTKSAMKKGAKSSADKVLAGTLYKGKTIKSITKGTGDHRYITTTDNKSELVSKDIINTLSRNVGTNKMLDKFEKAPMESKIIQAYKSLDIRKKKGIVDRKIVENYHNNYRNQLKKSGLKTAATSLVKCEGKTFTMPKAYADVLEKEGVLKIIKNMDK